MRVDPNQIWLIIFCMTETAARERICYLKSRLSSPDYGNHEEEVKHNLGRHSRKKEWQRKQTWSSSDSNNPFGVATHPCIIMTEKTESGSEATKTWIQVILFYSRMNWVEKHFALNDRFWIRSLSRLTMTTQEDELCKWCAAADNLEGFTIKRNNEGKNALSLIFLKKKSTAYKEVYKEVYKEERSTSLISGR